MNKWITTIALALLMAVSTGISAETAKTVDGKEIPVALDGATIILVEKAQADCKAAGTKYCPSWGGPNIEISPGVTGKTYSDQLRVQEDAYQAAKRVAVESDSAADWAVVRALALRTWVRGTIDNRLARKLKNDSFERGHVKSKEKGSVEGIVHMDRAKVKLAIETYESARTQGIAAQQVLAENADKTDESRDQGIAVVEQADGNIKWLQSMLTNENFLEDGTNKYKK